MTQGYRTTPTSGPTIRTDIIDVYVFRAASANPTDIELLQLRRARDPLITTWHPIMGHIEQGETATQCAVRELIEEVCLDARNRSHSTDTLRFGPSLWALEQTHPYYVPAAGAVVCSPRFAIEVPANWQPTLNDEHNASRWVRAADAPIHFLWPGQHAAISELTHSLLAQDETGQLRRRLQRVT